MSIKHLVFTASVSPTAGLGRLVPAAAFWALALLPHVAQAVPGDELWDTMWNHPGANDLVEACIEFNGNLVIGGDFNFVGDVAANKVAIYDGVNWAPLGIGFDNRVVTLAVYNNELYAGGWFNLSDGTPVGGLARWTGTQWVSVDGGTDFGVDDMVVYNGELVMVGAFTEVGSGPTTASGIAGWNGTTWNTFGDGATDGFPYAVEVYNGDLYVTGELYEMDYVSVGNLARFNGTTWSNPGNLTDDLGDPFEAYGEYLHVYDNKLIVTGYFLRAGGQALENFATYNGTTWGTLGADPSYFSAGAFEMGDYAGKLMVYGGGSVTYSWNGSIWLGDIFGGAVLTFCQWGSNLVIGGIFSTMNFVQAQNVIQFNGTTWSALATGSGASTGIEGFHAWNGELAVGGSKTRFGTVSGSLTATWDGAQWDALGTGIPGGLSKEVTTFATYQGDLIAGGNFTTAGGIPAERIARWDGASWNAMGAGSPGSSMFGMTVMGDSLYAGLYQSGYRVMRWDGAAWQSVGGTANNILWSLIEYNGQLVVGGSFITLGGNAITALATWDGAAWNEIGGSALNGSVYNMAVHDGRLYIAGTFTMAGGNPANRVAVWDGVSWAPVGDGVNNRVFDIAQFNGDIFVTGGFTASGGGGTPLNYVARWDGAAWDAMGSGLNDEGHSLGVYDGRLYVGGDFTVAGGKAAEGMSSWAMNQTGIGDGLQTLPLPLRAFPNPFRARTTVVFDLNIPGDAEILIHDVMGRLVAKEHLGDMAAGQHHYHWYGRDLRGSRVGAGTYFVTVRTSQGMAQGRVTVVR